MKRKSLWGISLLALAAITFQSCKKENGIDNNNVIKKPYALYVSDKTGAIFSTNNGDDYNTVFPGDGTPIRAMVTSKENIVIIKDKTLFYSENEGKTFNPYLPGNMVVPTNIPWPYFMLNVEDYDWIYVANQLGVGGISYSRWDNGKSFDGDTARIIDTPFTTESFTQLDNKKVFSYSLSSSKYGISHLYMKADKDSSWRPIITSLPSTSKFYLTHSSDIIIATDYEGTKGAWYSNDEGKTFTQYTGLPTTNLLATHAPFGKVILVGTKGMGIYKFDGTTFSASSSGITPGTTVYSITSKENIYKNNVSRQYVFAATSSGLYRSEDLAKSWVKVKDGDYRLAY